MRLHYLGSIVAALALAAPLTGHAATAADRLFFASAGLGAGGQGFGGVLSLNVVRGSMLYTVRTAATEEFDLFGPTPSQADGDLAVLVGRISRDRRGFASAAAGIGLTQTVRRGRLVTPGIWFAGPEHERIERRRVGVALDLRRTLDTRVAGVGLEVFGNLNPKGSFLGLAVTVQLGKLR